MAELGLLPNHEAEEGPSTSGAKVEDSDETRSFKAEGSEEEIEGSEEERPSEADEVGLLINIDEVGTSEVQDSDAYEAGRPSDAENSDEEPSNQISLPLPLPLPDSDRTGSSEGRIPISSLLNHDSDGSSSAGGRLSSIYLLLNPPPNTLEPEIQLKPDFPQITMKPV